MVGGDGGGGGVGWVSESGACWWVVCGCGCGGWGEE